MGTNDKEKELIHTGLVEINENRIKRANFTLAPEKTKPIDVNKMLGVPQQSQQDSEGEDE